MSGTQPHIRSDIEVDRGAGGRSRMIPVYRRGQVEYEPDPITWTPGGVEEQFSAAGYEKFARISNHDDSPSLEIVVRRNRDGEPEFLIEVGSSEDTAVVGAADIADTMDVLARWAPVVQVALLADLLGESDYAEGGVEYNRFAMIGALVADGASHRGQWAQEQRSERAARAEALAADKANRAPSRD